MKFAAPRACLVVLIACLLVGHATGQAEIVATYPFGQCVTVRSDPQSQRIWTGSGSGIFVLDDGTTPSDPQLASGITNKLRAEGLVRSIDLTTDHIYAAIQRAGLIRFPRDTTSTDKDWQLDLLSDRQGWVVDVPVRISGIDVVFVGTNEDNSTGSVRLLWANATNTDSPTEKDSVALSVPVYALATRVQGNTLTLLVGTACGGTGSPGVPSKGLIRYDFDLSAGLPDNIPQESAIWTASEVDPVLHTVMPLPTFVRDVVIDAEHDVAYVAAFTLGVRKIDLSGTDLQEVVGDGWPKVAPAAEIGRFDGLDLLDTQYGLILAAAAGPPLMVEKQIWGECTVPVPCDDEERATLDTGYGGIFLYGVDDPSGLHLGVLPYEKNSTSTAHLPVAPTDVVLREIGSRIRLDIAGGPFGLIVADAVPGDGGFDIERVSAFDKADGEPTSNSDDLLELGDYLFTSVENSIAIYPLSATNPLADVINVPSGAAGVLMSGFEAAAGFPTSLFTTSLKGTKFFEVVTGGSPPVTLVDQGFLDLDGRNYADFVLGPNDTPDGNPWLIVVGAADDASIPAGLREPEGSGIRVYRLAMSPTGHVTPHAAVPLGTWAPRANTYATGAFFHCHAEPAGGNDVIVWISYSPRDNGGGITEPNAGLLALKLTYTTTPTQHVEFTNLGKVPAVMNASSDPVGRVTYLASSNRVVVALGCNGLAAYSVSGLTSLPTLMSGGTWAGSSQDPASLLTPYPGPSPYVVVADLAGKLRVFDSSDLAAGPVSELVMRGATTAVLDAPSTVTGQPAFWVSDGTAGVHKVQFTSFP